MSTAAVRAAVAATAAAARSDPGTGARSPVQPEGMPVAPVPAVGPIDGGSDPLPAVRRTGWSLQVGDDDRTRPMPPPADAGDAAAADPPGLRAGEAQTAFRRQGPRAARVVAVVSTLVLMAFALGVGSALLWVGMFDQVGALASANPPLVILLALVVALGVGALGALALRTAPASGR